MAKKLEVYYFRDLALRPLDVAELKNIINISPSIRLYWGKEYVDFRFTSPTDFDLDVEKALQIFHPKGTVSVGLYPSGGSYVLLGRGVSENSIDIKFYELYEFCELSKKAQELVAMNVPFNNPEPFQNKVLKGEGFLESKKPSLTGGSQEFIYKDLFHEVKVRSYTDYAWIITDLEKNGFVDTYPSENILRTDERRFTLKPKSETINPDLRSYIGQTFEVDSLGTSFYSELSEGIVFLSSRYFKDTLVRIKTSVNNE